MKRRKDITLKDELPRLLGAQYDTGEITPERMERLSQSKKKKKKSPFVDVTGDGSKVYCCKEQYCIGTRNVKSMNQGEL